MSTLKIELEVMNCSAAQVADAICRHYLEGDTKQGVIQVEEIADHLAAFVKAYKSYEASKRSVPIR